MIALHTAGAAFVHLLTASGVVCSLFALVAISNSDINTAFMWLGLALLIDAVDGPLARFVDTKKHLPRFSGERLDLIIDYLNFVALPAFMVVKLPGIEGTVGLMAAAIILLSSLFHFADLQSKTAEGYFVGFPAIWNVVLFYIVAFKVAEILALTVIIILSVLTFIPLHWVHPIRVKKMRAATVLIVGGWTVAACTTVLGGFNVNVIESAVLIGAPLYFAALGLMNRLGMLS